MERLFNLDLFQKEPSTEVYSGSFQLNNQPVLTTFIASEGEDRESLQSRIYDRMRWMVNSLSRTLVYVTDELLETKNESWLNAGEGPMDTVGFQRGIRLEEVFLHADNSMELVYHAGAIFWGHQVVVRVHPDQTYDYATLEG